MNIKSWSEWTYHSDHPVFSWLHINHKWSLRDHQLQMTWLNEGTELESRSHSLKVTLNIDIKVETRVVTSSSQPRSHNVSPSKQDSEGKTGVPFKISGVLTQNTARKIIACKFKERVVIDMSNARSNFPQEERREKQQESQLPAGAQTRGWDWFVEFLKWLHSVPEIMPLRTMHNTDLKISSE